MVFFELPFDVAIRFVNRYYHLRVFFVLPLRYQWYFLNYHLMLPFICKQILPFEGIFCVTITLPMVFFELPFDVAITLPMVFFELPFDVAIRFVNRYYHLRVFFVLPLRYQWYFLNYHLMLPFDL